MYFLSTHPFSYFYQGLVFGGSGPDSLNQTWTRPSQPHQHFPAHSGGSRGITRPFGRPKKTSGWRHAQTDSFQQNKQDSWWRVCLPGTWNLLRRIWTQLLLLSYRDWMSLHTYPLPAPTSSGAACCWCWPGLEVGKRGSFHHPKTSPVQVSSSIFNITLHCVQ